MIGILLVVNVLVSVVRVRAHVVDRCHIVVSIEVRPHISLSVVFVRFDIASSFSGRYLYDGFSTTRVRSQSAMTPCRLDLARFGDEPIFFSLSFRRFWLRLTSIVHLICDVIGVHIQMLPFFIIHNHSALSIFQTKQMPSSKHELFSPQILGHEHSLLPSQQFLMTVRLLTFHLS